MNILQLNLKNYTSRYKILYMDIWDLSQIYTDIKKLTLNSITLHFQLKIFENHLSKIF